MTRLLVRLLNRIEIAQIRRFGRSVLSLLFRTPVLVLHTTGHRTGRTRSTPLAQRPDGSGGFLVVGGAAGRRATPDWVRNLRAHDRVRITIDRRDVDVRADELLGAERAVEWGRLRRIWPRIERYERRSGRTIPVFRLRPVTDRVR